MPSAKPDYSLTEAQKQHFLTHGWIKLDNCFSLDDPLCKQLMSDMWERLGMDPNDKSTWDPDRVHLPRRGDHAIPFRDFAPKAWAAICELSGGEQHILTEDKVMPPPMDEPVPQAVMNDSFIIALGNAGLEKQWQEAGQHHGSDKGETARPDGLTPGQAKLLDPYARNNYHVDGDFFHHFLDSPEQGLLPIVLFSNVKVGGGGTYIVPDAIEIMAKHLYEHPEGVMPDMSVVRDTDVKDGDGTMKKKEFDHGFYQNAIKTIPREKFVTATGRAGDVYLLHPLMVHSGVPNFLREPRIITNPPVALRQPFNFDRQDGSSYSLVERKTMLAIGKPDGLTGWKTTRPRTLIVPDKDKKWLKEKGQEVGVKQAKKHWAPLVL